MTYGRRSTDHDLYIPCPYHNKHDINIKHNLNIKQSRSSVTVYSARPTKRGLVSVHIQSRSSVNRVYDSKADGLKARFTPKTTEQNRIVRTGKSEAEVTNNAKLCSRYCTIEANY